MKVFLNNIDGSKLNIEYDNKQTHQYIYSNEGIFGFKHNKLYLMDISDVPVETIRYKENEFLIDRSEMTFKDVVYHIPFDHIFCEETIFKKNIGNSLIFVKRVFFDQTMYYFEIEGKLESFMLAKMFTFLI
jgi:hypothetical protein